MDDSGVVCMIAPVFRRIQAAADVVASATGAPCLKQGLYTLRIGKRFADCFQIPEEAAFLFSFQGNDLLVPEMIRAELQGVNAVLVEQRFDEIAILPESVSPEEFRKVEVAR